MICCYRASEVGSDEMHFVIVNSWLHCLATGHGVLKTQRLCTSFQEHTWSPWSGISSVAFKIFEFLVQVGPVCGNSGVVLGVYGLFPTMYSQDRLHAHVSARASFSISAYLVSVGVIARDMNETDRQELSGWSWRITPPRKDEASAATLVSLFGSYRANTGARVRTDFICSNAFCWSLPHVHWFPLWRRSLMLFVLSARCSENLLSWLTMPRNVLTSCTFGGGGRSAIACSFSGSASIPLKLITCPRNLTLSVLNWHLSRLSVTPASTRHLSTASNLWTCSV